MIDATDKRRFEAEHAVAAYLQDVLSDSALLEADARDYASDIVGDVIYYLEARA